MSNVLKEIDNLFVTFEEVNKLLDGQLLEISVKQHQITLVMSESLINIQMINNMLKYVQDPLESYISFLNDVLYFVLGGFSISNPDENIFYPFMKIINEFSEHICKCPSLEYVVSAQYIKCFLDKAGIKISDLKKYEEILEAKEKGELEMHPQRPYLLFINENYDIGG